MRKTKLDRMFKEKFLAPENQSDVYTPDHWKNFEQQLDKKILENKKNKFGFSLNQFLFFIAIFTIIVSSILLFINHADSSKSSLHAKWINSNSGRTQLHHNKKLIEPGNKTIAIVQPAVTENTSSIEIFKPIVQVEKKNESGLLNKQDENKSDDILAVKENNIDKTDIKTLEIQLADKGPHYNLAKNSSMMMDNNSEQKYNDSTKGLNIVNKSSKKGTKGSFYTRHIKVIPVSVIGF